MNLNYILLPEDYLPQPPLTNTAKDDKMEVDEVPMGEPMEVDDEVQVRPKRRVIRVPVYQLFPVGEPMEVDSDPPQPEADHSRPVPTIHVVDNASAQPWPAVPRPAWSVDEADMVEYYAKKSKISPASIVGGRRHPRKPSPSKAITPQRSPPSSHKMAEPVVKPVVSANPHVDFSKIATSSKVMVEDMPLLFEDVETSSGNPNVAHRITSKQPDDLCIKFSSPLSPVKQSKLDDNLFITSNRQSPDLITNDRWLKISRTPGRNIGNESVFDEYSDVDFSQVAAATNTANALFPEIKRFSPVRPTEIDEDFFLKPNRQTPDLAVNDRWLKISRTPDYNIYNESTMVGDDGSEYPSLRYPPTEDTDESLEGIDFSEADTSLNWASEMATPETPERIRRTKLFSPLSPVRQCKLENDDLFITSKRQTPDLVTNDRWLKISRTPGRNIDNESVFCDNDYADYSYLGRAYPLVEDSDSGLDKDYISMSTSVVTCTSGYLGDDSFSSSGTSHSLSSLASDESLGYLADISCSSFEDISGASDASWASIPNDQMLYRPCEIVSDATSRVDLSSMDLLIASLSNLVIDEGFDLEERIVNKSVSDGDRSMGGDSDAWQTAEETAPRDNSEDSGDGVTESFVEKGLATTQSGDESSIDEDSFDSAYPSSLVSSNHSGCACSSYAHSSSNNLSAVNSGISGGNTGSESETEPLEDVESLGVEEFNFDYDGCEGHGSGEWEDQSGNLLVTEPPTDAEVDNEDQELQDDNDLSEPGNETELDVNELEDDLKYIYMLPY